MAALVHHHQSRARNRGLHFFVQRQRRQLVLPTAQHQRGAGNVLEQRPAVGPPHDGRLLADKALCPHASGHVGKQHNQCSIIKMVGVQQLGQQLRHRRRVATFACTCVRHHAAAVGARFLGVVARAGIEQGQPRNTLGCLAHDFKCQIATHGKPGQRKAPRRHARQRLLRQRRHGVLWQQGKRGNRPVRAELCHLVLPQALITGQTRQQQQRKCRHSILLKNTNRLTPTAASQPRVTAAVGATPAMRPATAPRLKIPAHAPGRPLHLQ